MAIFKIELEIKTDALIPEVISELNTFIGSLRTVGGNGGLVKVVRVINCGDGLVIGANSVGRNT